MINLTRMERIRQNIVSFLLALGLWIAPREFQIVMMACLKMPEGIRDKMISGETFGVVLLPWGIDAEDTAKAIALQAKMMEAAQEFRTNLFLESEENIDKDWRLTQALGPNEK